MKAQELYKLSLSILFEREKEDEDFAHFFLPFLNLLLAESLMYENSIREFHGEKPLAVPPYIETMEQDVPYDPVLLMTAIPNGVASYYFQDDMDNFKSQDYRARYISALTDCAKVIATDIVNLYSRGGI